MMPDNVLSTTVVPGTFLFPDSMPFKLREDVELGGIAHQDPSQGLEYQPWRAWLSAEGSILVQPVNLSQPPYTVALDVPRATFISLAFDSNMRVTVAWRMDGIVYLYWYDSVEEDFVLTEFSGLRSPRLTHDDKREAARVYDDVILFYCRDSVVCWRNQRDRYLVEYVGATVGPNVNIYRVGMHNGLRLQLEVY